MRSVKKNLTGIDNLIMQTPRVYLKYCSLIFLIQNLKRAVLLKHLDEQIHTSLSEPIRLLTMCHIMYLHVPIKQGDSDSDVILCFVLNLSYQLRRVQ